MEYIAHIREDGAVQTVKEHLEQTAEQAGKFASSFDAESLCYAAGLLHDIGKYSNEFQRRIRGNSLRTDHSTAGAKEAMKIGLIPAAFGIAGHHSGIPDGGTPLDAPDSPTLCGRLKKEICDYSNWEKEISLPEVRIPDWLKTSDNFAQCFFVRMLYSCLVDADYLDTETFMRGRQDRGEYDTISVLLHRLQGVTSQWLDHEPKTILNKGRNAILRICIESGKKSPRGLYTLTVPTGGGKTEASLSFALEQAAALHMERVIYVIPYTSIIDQTAGRYCTILGAENVLAHYSEADFLVASGDDLSQKDYRRVLSAENWDAPVIVTTAVQFFESLFSNRSAKCRKLHNIANSVIVFDEAQTLPNPYLMPCVAAIAQLVLHYKSTVVLCTATQPELNPYFANYGLRAKEICPVAIEKKLIPKRNSLKDLGTLSKEELMEKLSESRQVLCVVNRRKTAQELYRALPEDGSFCLTTLLCPMDRKKKLDEIRRRLKKGEDCRVVSTSLIEAGVDVDFPAAFREETGLDSYLQTAGRCNREGREKNPENRPVYLFKFRDIKAPAGMRQQITALRNVQRKKSSLEGERNGRASFDDPDLIKQYFLYLFGMKGEKELDVKEIMDAMKNGREGVSFPFRYVSDAFKLIDAHRRTIYIPKGEGEEICNDLQNGRGTRNVFRRAGSFSVSVYEEEFERLYFAGALEMINEYDAILIDRNQYDDNLGLHIDLSSGQALFIDF